MSSLGVPAAAVTPERAVKAYASATGRISTSRVPPRMATKRSMNASTSAREPSSIRQKPPTSSFDSLNGPSISVRSPRR